MNHGDIWKWYGNALLKALTGQIDFDTDTFKVLLTTSLTVDDVGSSLTIDGGA